MTENMSEHIGQKLPMKTKLGYAFAAVSDGTAYVFFYSFFMLFLTDVVGVNPLWAGSVSLVVILWSAITDPIVGYLSDRSQSKYGRRRPFMIAGIFPWVITLTLLFLTVKLSPQLQFGYYVVMAVLFWTSYSICDVPLKALGAELTQDYSERSTIRLYGQVLSCVGVAIAGSSTLALVGYFTGAFGVSRNTGWTLVAFTFAVISFIGYFLTWSLTRGTEKPLAERQEVRNKDNIFKTYWNVATKVRPYRMMMLIIFAFMCGNSLYGAAIMYAYTYLLGFHPGQIAALMMYGTAIAFVLIPVINWLVKRFDKKNIITVSLLITTVSLFAFKFLGLNTVQDAYIYSTLYNISNLSFWAIIWALVYDLSEIDELSTGLRREGAITSLGSFIQKLGSAVAMWLLGIILSISNYNPMAPVQAPEALNGILNAVTLIPGVFALITLMLLLIYPVNKEKFGLILRALDSKKATGDFDKTGLEKIL